MLTKPPPEIRELSSSVWPQASMAPGPGVYHAHPAPEDSVDLTQLWGIVRDNWRMVLAIAAAVFVLVMARCLTSPMSFLSTARMYMGEADAKAQSTSGIDISTGGGDASAEIEVLRSRAMVRKGVLASGLNVSISPLDWKPPVFWKWLVSGRQPELLDPAGRLVTATQTSLAEGVIDARWYRVKFSSDFEYELIGADIPPAHGRLGVPLQLSEATITLVSGSQGPQAGIELDVIVRPVDDVVEQALASLTVSVAKGPGAGSASARVLLLEFINSSRRLGVSFLDHLMHGYLDTQREWNTEDASAVEAFVTEQLRTMQDSLDKTQAELAKFRTDNRVVILENEAQATAQQVNRYEEQRIAAQLELSSLRQLQKVLQNSELPVEGYMVGEASDAVLQRMAASLAEARERMTAARTEYADGAPEYKKQKVQVEAQLVAIRSYVNGRAARAEKQVAALNKVIGDSESKLKSVPGAELALSQMGRETDVANRMYNYLLERKQQASIVKASTVSKNRVLDHPYVSLREDSPKLALHLASGMLGLLLGAAAVILRGLFSGVFRRENDVRGVLGPVQLFGRIPTRSRARSSDDGQRSVPVFDVLAGNVDHAYTEAFRSLRTNLYRALPGEYGKVVLVTSPGHGDGKTTCALSLAAMLAADNRRVLVIDADVRNPTHHDLFGVPSEPGLQEAVALQHHQHWRDSVRTLCLASGSFDSVCTGSHANAELLSDAMFSTFLVNTRAQYDFIVIDGPSYPAVSDPLVLAPLSDFVLSVVRLGSTARKLAEEHLSGMFSVARGHAVAVNNVEASVLNVRSSMGPEPRLSAVARRLR